jgi:hypothetical protein
VNERHPFATSRGEKDEAYKLKKEVFKYVHLVNGRDQSSLNARSKIQVDKWKDQYNRVTKSHERDIKSLEEKISKIDMLFQSCLKEKSHLQSQIAVKEKECQELIHKESALKSNVRNALNYLPLRFRFSQMMNSLKRPKSLPMDFRKRPSKWAQFRGNLTMLKSYTIRPRPWLIKSL